MSNEKQKISATMSKKIAALKKLHCELDAARREMFRISDRAIALQCEIVSEHINLKPGDFIVWGPHKDHRGRVKLLTTSMYQDGPKLHHIVVTRILKNGSDGNPTKVYGFEKWEKVTS